MRCIIRMRDGQFYGVVNGKPAWVQSRAEARVFSNVKLARGVLAVLRRTHIEASIERVMHGSI